MILLKYFENLNLCGLKNEWTYNLLSQMGNFWELKGDTINTYIGTTDLYIYSKTALSKVGDMVNLHMGDNQDQRMGYI